LNLLFPETLGQEACNATSGKSNQKEKQLLAFCTITPMLDLRPNAIGILREEDQNELWAFLIALLCFNNDVL
jgi:hypothetical protein